MNQIILSAEQAKVIVLAGGKVELLDADGNHLGYALGPTGNEEIAEAKRRLNSSQPRLTTQQLLDHLQSLESQ